MGYLELVNKYTAITNEIGYIEELMKKYKDLALKRMLKRLREEQSEVKREIDRYNGVKNGRLSED